ncbi:type I-F CRISPR-associated protein Csy3 [Lysobacter pythonis]|uniref:Type I-F CRISPR-associated protein Csy3 n=1 Tax=Solilutibacter pythonis TaxID=2483112 RepID=A0A3M2HSA6_9GAMM|nr:type I-F CRISPR-associated protein Csy3 [Lysobacter pythonis]RMH89057.1 type I-F CRISPR-associated protein Csy3 [Lysobacter pythonis]
MTIKNPSVLAFERKLDPSDAVFNAGRWDGRGNSERWEPVRIREKSVRGTISNRLKAGEQDPLKLDAAIDKPNLQTVDVAALPMSADTLRVRFTLRVLPGMGEPSACNESEYRERLLSVVSEYKERHGLAALAQRYAINLANGRFLWRNRIGAEQVEVHVDRLRNGAVENIGIFDALAFSLRDFEVPASAQSAVSDVKNAIQMGLSGQEHVLLQVTAYLRVGEGQEVFPSQELILDRGRGDKSKTLYGVGSEEDAVAAMHSQKIGNALRTVDTWYQGADVNGPIAVEPYGSVTTQGKAYRQPRGSKDDFYTLFDGWMLKDKVPAVEQQHYVMAVLLRGGVFGEG